MLGPEYRPGRGWQTRIDHKRSDFLQSPDGLFCVAALQFDRGNAALELSRRNSSRAFDLLQAATPYELGDGGMFINNVYPAYLRGQAYLLARNGPAAAAEFQQMLDHKGIVLNSVTGSLAHPQIGRAHAMAGDTARAKAAYQDFFNVWKDADPNIPILKEAKAEYAKLK